MVSFQIFSIKRFSGQILITVFSSLFILSTYFLVNTYYSSIDSAEKETYAKLNAIATTLSSEIDGDQHQYLTNKYKQKDDIKTSDQDSIYFHLQQKLNTAYYRNQLNTAIYTLIFDSVDNDFSFVLISSEVPSFRHSYEKYPPILKEKYQEGGLIPQYQSENGTWLSAFVPIKNSAGKVVAIIEADQKFDDFLAAARKELLWNVFKLAICLILVGILLFRQLKKIIRNEEHSKRQLQQYNLLIEEKNKNIIDSINYASRIQNAITGKQEHIQKYLPESFLIYKPKDIVSGDFVWFRTGMPAVTRPLDGKGSEKEIIVSVVDCTGHGVPGALMSVIGYSLLNEIVQGNVSDPGTMLYKLNKGVINNLNQDQGHTHTHDGMDVALCFINLQEMKIQYAGANRPLILLRDGQLNVIKGDKYPVGGMHFGIERTFSTQVLDVKKGDTLYLFSDGYADQFGGNGIKAKKFMLKSFKDLLIQVQGLSMNEQSKVIEKAFTDWKGTHDQVDDVSLMGIRF